jgi:hypothetical protein
MAVQAVPSQKPLVRWQVVPVGQASAASVPPSMEQLCAHVPPVMQVWPAGQCVIVLQDSGPSLLPSVASVASVASPLAASCRQS